MSLQELLQREKQVVIKGQSVKFRIIKYIILILLAVLAVMWRGWIFTGYLFLILAVLSVCIHFLFRWKSDGWSKSWGPYKKVPFEE